METDTKYCVPELREKFQAIRKRAKDQGIEIVIICTARSEAEQKALYAQGRQSILFVNDLRHNANLGPIRETQNKKPVTWTLNSKHIIGSKRQLSEAVDFAILKNGKIDWYDDASYKIVADIAVELGLTAGYYFKTKDSGHLEIKG
jgi:hypothetical protein